jgi:imidazole glycerol-phosphate synthase subunit HisF
MVQTRVIPCLLLQYGSLVRTTQFKGPRFVGDPVDAVRVFNRTEADELILLDITASHTRGLFGPKVPEGPDLELIARVSDESTVPLAYGGGVRTIEDISGLLRRGVDKVLVNARALEDASFVAKASGIFGSRRIAVSIDAKRLPDGRHEVYTGGGSRPSGIDPVSHAKRMESMGAGEILLSSIDQDGTLQGYDLPLVRAVAGAVSIPVMACGGAGSLDHFGAAIRAGASVAVASNLFIFDGGRRSAQVSYPRRTEIERAMNGAPEAAVAGGRG